MSDIAVVEPLVVSLAEAAALLGISRGGAYRMHREGTFPVRVVRIGGEHCGRLMVSRRLLEEYVNGSESGA